MRESDVWGDISNVTDVGVTREGYTNQTAARLGYK